LVVVLADNQAHIMAEQAVLGVADQQVEAVDLELQDKVIMVEMVLVAVEVAAAVLLLLERQEVLLAVLAETELTGFH
jgi:hypothetical protein